ncbi:AbrB family transcriptional regulator [Mesorhizobium sp. CA14]|uniref:AbrB family transcriptional regulator n=1 Tax=Mesorhizobium sp. CA14 TaxID=2876642 RepID=UPI0029620014|nr:AbrB family transcriptional regulator [Mesorhizobium sp. CA14]
MLDIDPLTAYLATSPVGVDTVAHHRRPLRRTSTPPSSCFIMTLQSARFQAVLLIGPSVARLVARNVGA